MARLVDSGVPGLVKYEDALWLLAKRAVLATAVCNELMAAGEAKWLTKRPESALGFLHGWLTEHGLRLRSLEGMEVPDGSPDQNGNKIPSADAAQLAEAIRRAEKVCDAYEFLHSADTHKEFDDDVKELGLKLAEWAASR